MKKKKSNILITAPNLNTNKNVSGISTVVINIIKQNTDNVFFHFQVGSNDYTKKSVRWFFNIVFSFLKFPFYLRKNKINIVHLNIPFDTKGITRDFILLCLARLLKVKTIAHIHGGEFLMTGVKNPLIRRLAKIILHKSNKVIVLSELESKSLTENFNYRKAEILHNAVDTNSISYTPFTPKKETIQLLFLGRIHESKGVLDIIESFKLLKDSTNFRFVACGAGPSKDIVVNECRHLLKNRFEFKGVVAGAEKDSIIKESDIFILPSRWGEGLPMALLETMASGMVPIVSDDASISKVVKHLENGLIVKKNNPNDLASKIELLINDQSLTARLSIEARNTISENYDILKYNDKLCSIYRSTQLGK